MQKLNFDSSFFKSELKVKSSNKKLDTDTLLINLIGWSDVI